MNKDHQPTHAAQEEDVLRYWDENDCFQKSIANRPEGQPYVFYDGPPFATGLPHYGHIVASTMKDVVPRFWTMRGFRVERTWGWDCHGLPIENIVEKKFDLNSKQDIEKFGIDTFNNRCHEEVLTYAEEWKKVIHRLGRWVDMERAYKTMDLPFMESNWWVFKSLWDLGLIYEGFKPMHICPRCETVLSNFEVTQGYKDVKDLSVTAKFELVDEPGTFLLAWTTTPWTLPGNFALALGPEVKYVRVKSEGEQYILAKELVTKIFADKDYEVLGEIDPVELKGQKYKPLFPYYQDDHDIQHIENAYQVIVGDFVNTEEGTGIVHIAGGFGEDDMLASQENDLPIVKHVGLDGRFTSEVSDWPDREVKPKDDPQSTDVEIIKYLAAHGTLFAKAKYEHSYPHCWRCDTPLLNYSTSSWFVKVSEIRERLVATNKEINWVPANMKEGRFGKWLEGARDWAISRSRYWGTPLPVWRAEDGELICVGSLSELEQLSGQKVDNLHKHIVDKIVIERGGKEFHRIPEVLDCWFESGSMPYAQLHYPFENETKFERGFPAEFIAEGQDQTRGWFYTLHVLANALFQMPAYKNVIVNGIVLAEDGKKMSKRLNNYPDPMEVMKRYGSDAVRYYLMSSPVMRAENLRFAEREVDEVAKKFINITRNVLAFYELYREHDDGRSPKAEHVLDRWIMARLAETLECETAAMEAYDLQTAARVLQTFVTDLSTWYVRRSRDRLKALATSSPSTSGGEAVEALATLRTVLDTFSKMLAPFMPFLAEIIYQKIDGDFLGREDRLSVHLEDWPAALRVDADVLEAMGQARAIVSRALEIREEAGRAIKQPLAAMSVKVPTGKLDEALAQVIKAEVNVKAIDVCAGELEVELDLELTPELVREGMVRDISRRANQLRKEAGLTIQDRIELKIWSASDEVRMMFAEHSDELQESTLATRIDFEKVEEAKYQNEFRVAENDVWIGF